MEREMGASLEQPPLAAAGERDGGASTSVGLAASRSEQTAGARDPTRSLTVPYQQACHDHIFDVDASIRLTADRAAAESVRLEQSLTRAADRSGAAVTFPDVPIDSMLLGMPQMSLEDSFEEAFCAKVGLPMEVAKAWAAWFMQGADGPIDMETIRSKVAQLVQAEESVDIVEQILWEVLLAHGGGEARCEKVARFLALSWASSHCGGEVDKELQSLAEQLLQTVVSCAEGLRREEWAKIRDIFPDFSSTVPTPLSAGRHEEKGDDVTPTGTRAGTFRRAFATKNTTSRVEQARNLWIWVFQPWQRSRIDVAWTLLLSCLFFALGYYGFHVAAVAVDNFLVALALSHWYSLARGCGAALNPMCAALLLPICGEVLAFLRHLGAHNFLPLDSAVAFHEWLGRWILIVSLTHTFGHVLNFLRADDFTVWERLISKDGFNPAFTGIAGLTGTLLLTMLVIIVIFALRRVRGHNVFWCTHFLWLPWFVCLCLHAPNCWKWVCTPLAIWVWSRLVRLKDEHSSSGRTSIVHMEVLPAGCTHLRIARPDKFDFVPGMWCRVKVPKLSSFEWHPFTISSAPEIRETFSLHIRAAGDWTGSLRDLARRLPAGEEVPLKVQGPFGAPTQHAWDSEHVVLVGAGIGVTPFSSILQSLALRRAHGRFRSPGALSLEGATDPAAGRGAAEEGGGGTKVEHVDFIWVNRELGAFTWLTRLLARLAKEDRVLRPEGEPFISFHLYLTSLKDDPRALLKLMLSLAVETCPYHVAGRCNEIDKYPITVITDNVIPGRPDWRAILNKIRYRQGNGSVKVLYCGPKPLGDAIHKQCTEFGFAFRKENF